MQYFKTSLPTWTSFMQKENLTCLLYLPDQKLNFQFKTIRVVFKERRDHVVRFWQLTMSTVVGKKPHFPQNQLWA